MSKISYKSIRLRMVIVGILFSLLYGVIGAKAVYLQTFRGSWLSQKAANQYESSFVSNGKRGTIYDTNHIEMAVTTDTTSIAASPSHIKNAQMTATTLVKNLKIDKKPLYKKLISNRSFVWIKRHVTPKETETLKNLNFSGINFIPEHSRVYPNKTLAAQVIGFSGIDGRGLEGIEFNYDNYLKGSAKKFTVTKDALGRGFDADQTLTGHSGNNLVLTLDRAIQYITEKALEEAVSRFHAKSGIAIVMAPKTGAILALAHFPFFNPNAFKRYSRETWRNRAITDPFEPGSTMKIFVAAAAIESGYCSPNTIFFCENGKYRIHKNLIHDTHPHGWLSLQQIVKYSSNIGSVKVTETIGKKTLYKYLKSFGFGEKTGIDCPGETSGSLSPYKRWTPIDAGTISFGQGISASALQLITAASAIANNGILMKPYIVQAVIDQNGGLIKSFTPQKIKRVISKQTAQTVRRIMNSVTTAGGTGVAAAIEGYSVCGKTGTAQKVNRQGTYAKGKYIASFIGFAPSENPEISVFVMVDEPQSQYYGSIVSAPAFKKITLETLNYLNIPPKTGNDKLRVSWKNEVNG